MPGSPCLQEYDQAGKSKSKRSETAENTKVFLDVSITKVRIRNKARSPQNRQAGSVLLLEQQEKLYLSVMTW
jgi:hypothetical protein